MIYNRIILQITFFLFASSIFMTTCHGQSRDTFPTEKEILQMKVDIYDAGKYLEKSSGGLTIGAIFSVFGLGTMVYGIVNGEKSLLYGGAGVNALGIIVMATTAGPLSKAGLAMKRAGAPKKINKKAVPN